ncbi:ZNHI3 protein, partial [Ramphastos sulfuratus]|nr:ZNHI3 protein [Ramphastos sulfuratus]
MRSARPCGVCQAAEAAKYRCPSCAAAYCSVPCCRTHKGEAREALAPPAALLLSPTGSPWSVEDILTEDDEQDRVPLQKLKLLGESEELQGLLLNPHLRQLLLILDQAEDKSSLMKKYMQEPLFVEFADCCLRIVEPPEKENILPE